MGTNSVKEFFSTKLTEKLLGVVILLMGIIWADMRETVKGHTNALQEHAVKLEANTVAVNGLRSEVANMDGLILDRIDKVENRVWLLEKER